MAPTAAPTASVAHVAAAQAVLHGAQARAARQPVQECPYDCRGDATDRFLARYWIKGWSRAHR